MKRIRMITLLAAALLLCSCKTAEQLSDVSESAAETVTETATVSKTVTESITETATIGETTSVTVSETMTITETTSETTAKITALSETTTTISTSAAETITVTEAMTVSPVMEQYLESTEALDEIYSEISKVKDQPVVHILTRDGNEINSKEEYNETVIDIFNCDEKYRLTAEAGVKVRGNSSAKDSTLPYRIKFTKKQNMLGLHNGMKYKSWVLLKSNWNLIPDFMALSLAREIFNGEYYSSDCTYVNVYINAEYKGLYLLCEHTQAAERRVDIKEPKSSEKQPDIGYLLEIDNYYGEDPTEPYFVLDYNNMTFTDMLGETRVLEPDGYTIKSDTTSDEQREFIEKYMKSVFDICYEAIENNNPMMFDENYNVVPAKNITPRQAVEAIVDTKSLTNMLILEELVHNYDVGAGSFFMALDFSENSIYKKLTFLAPWDFNWSYEGKTNDVYYAGAFQTQFRDGVERSNVWLMLFMKADWFREMVMDKWTELQSDGSLDVVVANVCEQMSVLENDLGEENWRIDSGLDIAYFVDGRIRWLNSVWNKDKHE